MNNAAPPLPHDKLLTQYTGRAIPPGFLDIPVTDADELEVGGWIIEVKRRPFLPSYHFPPTSPQRHCVLTLTRVVFAPVPPPPRRS